MATRLYLRDAASYEAPTAGTKSAVLPNAASNDGNSGNPFENRSLLTVRGQTLPDSIITRTSIGSTAHVDQYMGRFTSRKLAAQTIAANTWTCAVATLETNTAANSLTMLSVYVWRPSNSSVVGYIYDSHTALGVEWGASLDGQVLTFSGSSVAAQAGDVIVMEFWRHTAGQGSTTARLQQLNYNGYVDVTGTTTADPASYLETPQNLTFDTPYLPTSISGVFIETPGFGGPVMDGNGNLYVLAEVTELEPDPAIYKSTDGGLTWAEVDVANRPSGYGDLECASLILSGNKIKFARMRSSTSATHLSYHEFNVSTHPTDPDEWALSEAVVSVAAGDPTQEQLTLLERSNGDLVLVYGEWVSSSSSRIAYRKKPSGGAWGAAVGVYTGAIGSCAVLGANDKVHIFCKEDTSSAVGGSANQIVHLSLNSSDVLSSAEVVNDTAVTSLENMPGPAVYYDDSGTETVYVAWGKSDGFLAGAFVINDGTPSAEETITDQIVWFNPPDTGPLCPIAALAVDAATKTIYCAYSNNPSNTPTAQAPASEGDLYLATRTHGVGWGTDVELRDGARIQDIFANVYTHSGANGGATVLGMFYDDANGPFYDEYVIAEGSTGVNGTVSVTLGALTAASAATVRVSGAASPSLGALTSTSAGTVGNAGVVSVTLGSIASAAAGTVANEADAAPTLGAVTLSATGGAPAAEATLAVTLGEATLAAAGALAVSGAAAAMLGAATVASAGTVLVAGAAGIELGSVSASAAASVSVVGSAAVGLDALTTSAAAVVANTGAAAATLGAVTIQAEAAATDGPTANLAVTLGDLTVASAATLSVVGSTVVSLDALGVTSEAAIRITGAADATLGALAVAATVGSDQPEASAEITLDPMAAAAEGRVRVSGDVQTTLAPLSTISVGTVLVSGAFDGTLGGIAVQSGGTVLVRADLTATLGALTIAAMDNPMQPADASRVLELEGLSRTIAVTGMDRTIALTTRGRGITA